MLQPAAVTLTLIVSVPMHHIEKGILIMGLKPNFLQHAKGLRILLADPRFNKEARQSSVTDAQGHAAGLDCLLTLIQPFQVFHYEQTEGKKTLK